MFFKKLSLGVMLLLCFLMVFWFAKTRYPDASKVASQIATDLASKNASDAVRGVDRIGIARPDVVKKLVENYIYDDRPSICQWSVYHVSVPYGNESQGDLANDTEIHKWEVGDSVFFALKDRYEMKFQSKDELKCALWQKYDWVDKTNLVESKNSSEDSGNENTIQDE